ncbi:hypothetical protein Agabi119p4_4645 [Agaricus bisporus var. burnettii]|uniref:Uncharacterized protein n=1 Tax=Agaricus bisporus var. burnettii TaxID=192524 RepID=A0A8H7KHK1_AGABI|nr:hypothetical protein Agabi119p4_4645 [Agaricus bisporus var. burnettii]
MCYPCGSVDLSVKLCPMCKVFPHTRCPHKREICRNRAVHPRFDVMFLKNAEVDSFNGCGWCKWANFLQHKVPLANNQGWPGCCRAPQPSEYRFISVVDWKAVSTVHNIPIPPDVKIMLDTISAASPSSRRSTPPPAKSSSPALPTNAARNSPPPRPSTLNRADSSSKERPSVALAIPGKNKASPKQNVAALGSVRSTASSTSSSSPKSHSGFEIHQSHRHRQAIPDFGEAIREKERKGDTTTRSSPPNASKGLEGEIAAPLPRRLLQSRRNSSPSSNVSASSKAVDKVQDGPVRRRSPHVTSPSARSVASNASLGRASGQRPSPPISGEPKKDEDSRSSSGSSDGHSSGGSGSLSDSTVTSDGGFTDYLSEESEAELQRQAEARAALQAQNQIEENEFKAVRQRLAHVDLRPPKSWSAAGLRMGIAASGTKI